jgi:hypothetical protein
MKGVSSKRLAGTGNFTNHGGPVVTSPQVRAVYWGSSWHDSNHVVEQARYNSFLSDLLQSSVMNLLSQYGVGSGNFVDGSFSDLTIPANLTDAQIQAILQGYFSAGSVPEPNGNQAIFIFLDETVAVNDPGAGLVLCEPSGDTAFGYHNFFITAKGNPAYYAIIPALTNACLQASCGGNAGCTLSLNDTQEQRVTEVTTHEFGELCSDPQLNAWTDSSGNEIGDVCAGNDQDISVNGRTWRVQTLWDNNANACDVGASGTPPPPPPPPPVPPPPPGSTSSSDVILVNLLAYGFAKLIGKA